MQDGSRTVKGNNYCSLWPDLSAVVIQSPSILRAPQLARAARGVPQRRLPASLFAFAAMLSLLSLFTLLVGNIHVYPRRFADLKWFEDGCVHVLVYNTGIVRNELIMWYVDMPT